MFGPCFNFDNYSSGKLQLTIFPYRIRELPRELGYLKNLKKLMIYKNELSEIPEEIGHCQALQVLDISCNNITMFPEGIYHCSLSELHCDENPLLEHLPVLSQNVNDVFYLKVLFYFNFTVMNIADYILVSASIVM